MPLITPWLSSLWIGLVTPVDPGVARPLVEGLSTATVVTDGSGAELFDVTPIPFMDVFREALAEDPGLRRAPKLTGSVLPGGSTCIPRTSTSFLGRRRLAGFKSHPRYCRMALPGRCFNFSQRG